MNRHIITMSTEALCATEKDCFCIGSHISKTQRSKWIDDRDLYIYKCTIYTPVKTITGRKYWMSVMTGTLYNNNGLCMSGTIKINPRQMREAKEECRDILMSKSPRQ